VQGLLARFPEDVRAHLDARGCPRAAARVDPFAPGSPERTAIEGTAG
jgi:hypothetical protein